MVLRWCRRRSRSPALSARMPALLNRTLSGVEWTWLFAFRFLRGVGFFCVVFRCGLWIFVGICPLILSRILGGVGTFRFVLLGGRLFCGWLIFRLPVCWL